MFADNEEAVAEGEALVGVVGNRGNERGVFAGP